MRDFRGDIDLEELVDDEKPRRPAPGKVTLSAQIPSEGARPTDEAPPHPLATPIQRLEAVTRAAPVTDDPFALHQAAARGVAGSGGSLPHLEQVQQSFGRHDVSNVRAHVGDQATGAAGELGARAYATGDDIAFAESPSLHTVAHEAAHVVQQRGGVDLPGGIGAAGDSYERHADSVADAVVRGESAEGLLDSMAGASGGAAVQCELEVSDANRDRQGNILLGTDTFSIENEGQLRAAVIASLTAAIDARHHARLRERIAANRTLATLAAQRDNQSVRLTFRFTWQNGELSNLEIQASLGAYNSRPDQENPNAPSTDPERPPSAYENVVERGGQWNGRAIASNWTQLDGHTETANDSFRCGYASTLVVHINAGFDATKRCATQTGAQLDEAVPRIPEDYRDYARELARDCSNLNRRAMADWRYVDLDKIAEALYMLGERGRVAARPTGDSVGRVAGVGTEGIESSTDERGTTHGPEAVRFLRERYEGNRYRGIGEADDMAERLRRFRNVGLVLSVPSIDLERDEGGHAVTLGADNDGVVYLYDPLPRRGRQMMFWRTNRDLIEPYFTGNWEVSSVVAGATEHVHRRAPSR